jgi:hypothetical protein
MQHPGRCSHSASACLQASGLVRFSGILSPCVGESANFQLICAGACREHTMANVGHSGFNVSVCIHKLSDPVWLHSLGSHAV